MQKQKNLLPGLFLCVFSRIAEPLVDFISVIYWLFPLFYLGQTFFAGKKGVSVQFYTGPFCAIRPHKKARARHTFTSTRFYLACRRAPRKAPAHAAPLQARGFIGHAAAPHKKPPASARSGPLKNYPFGALYRTLFTHTKGPRKKPRD